MNLPPEHLPLAVLLTLIVAGLVITRLWLRRKQNAAQARLRILGFGLVLGSVAFIGLAFTLPSEPRTWVGLGLIFLSLALTERTRSRLRKEMDSTVRHEA